MIGLNDRMRDYMLKYKYRHIVLNVDEITS